MVGRPNIVTTGAGCISDTVALIDDARSWQARPARSMALPREKRAVRDDYSRHACCGSEPPLTTMKHEKIEGNQAVVPRGKPMIVGCSLLGGDMLEQSGKNRTQDTCLMLTWCPDHLCTGGRNGGNVPAKCSIFCLSRISSLFCPTCGRTNNGPQFLCSRSGLNMV